MVQAISKMAIRLELQVEAGIRIQKSEVRILNPISGEFSRKSGSHLVRQSGLLGFHGGGTAEKVSRLERIGVLLSLSIKVFWILNSYTEMSNPKSFD